VVQTFTSFAVLGEAISLTPRHECAHLRSSTGFGITYGDARVDSDVEPLLAPLEVLAYEVVKKRGGLSPLILSNASDISGCLISLNLKDGKREPIANLKRCVQYLF
jgi:hypothetical protein